MDEMKDGLEKYTDALLKASRPTDFRKDVHERISSLKKAANRLVVRTIGAILLVPEQLGENRNVIFNNQIEVSESTHPVVIYENDWYAMNNIIIAAEGEKVCDCEDLSDALACLVAVFYIFNIAYPTKSVRTLTFMQKMTMNLHDKTKTPRLVIELARKLNGAV